MKRANWLITLSLFCISAIPALAQKKADISGDITFLGMDFTQTKFIGSAAQFKDADEITSSEFRDKYIPSWNQLFINEQKKYDVAKAVKVTQPEASSFDLLIPSMKKIKPVPVLPWKSYPLTRLAIFCSSSFL